MKRIAIQLCHPNERSKQKQLLEEIRQALRQGKVLLLRKKVR